MTQEERRIKILEKRLRLLAEYLDRFEGVDSAPTFAEFIKAKGVTYAMFVKDLPPGYDDVPASGMERILEYAIRLQDLHAGQYRIAEMEEIAADGNNLERGYIKYQPGQYIREDCGCGCGGGCGGGDVTGAMGDDKSSSADGNDHDGEEPYLQYIFQEGTEPGLNFAATGDKICIKPIAPILSEKIAPGQWRSYRNKKAKYEQCKRDAAEAKASGRSKAKHLLNLSNPGFAITRASFLKLVAYNIFGLAQTFDKMRKDPNQSYWKKIQAMYYNFGGKDANLDKNVSIGYKKKPVFKPKGWKPKGANADGEIYSADGEIWFNGEAWTAAGIAAMVTAAAGLIATMTPVIKGYKRDKGEPDDFNPEGTADPSYAGDVPEGSPDDAPGEGLSTGAWIGISVGAALVLTIVGVAIYKATK